MTESLFPATRFAGGIAGVSRGFLLGLKHSVLRSGIGEFLFANGRGLRALCIFCETLQPEFGHGDHLCSGALFATCRAGSASCTALGSARLRGPDLGICAFKLLDFRLRARAQPVTKFDVSWRFFIAFLTTDHDRATNNIGSNRGFRYLRMNEAA